jgi:hypothetical protein
MSQHGEAMCNFRLDDSQDGKLRLIAIPAGESGLLMDRHIILELGSKFEINDAKALAELMNTRITHIRIAPTR